MSDIRFNRWLHQSGTGGVSQDSSGNIGIGSTQPLSALDLGTGNIRSHNIHSTGIVTTIGLDINGNADISGNLNVGGVLTYEDVTNIDAVGIITAQAGIRVTGGSVGIGTDNPSTMLEVGNQNSSANGAITVSKGEIIGGGTGPVINLKHGPAGGTQRTHQIYSYIGDLRIAADSNENMEFHTGGSESLRITSAGLIGIGQASPQGDLHIGNINGSKNVIMHSANQGNARIRFREGGSIASGFNEYSIGMVGLNNALTVEGQGAGEIIRIMGDTGRIGIGTHNPGTNLDVFGGVRSDNDSENFQVYASNGFTRGLLQVSPSGTGLDIKSTFNNSGYISASTISGGTLYERLRITSGGLLGLGTIDPSLTGTTIGMHIAGGNAALKLQNTNNGDWAFIEYADESNTTRYVQGYRDSNGVYSIRPGTSLNATPGITLDSNGNVGIHETSPARQLSVYNDSNTGVEIKSGTTGQSSIFFTDTADGNIGMIGYYHSDDSMFLRTNNATRVTITSDGYVTKPNTPAFCVYKNAAQFSLSAGDTFIFDSAEFNVGGHYNTSNGRFTAPTTGTYVFHFYSIYLNTSANDYIQMYRNNIRIMVGDVHFTNSIGSQWDCVHYSRVIQLNANDYVHMRAGTGHTFHGNNWGGWSGYMLG